MIINVKTTSYNNEILELFNEYKIMKMNLDIQDVIHESLLRESNAPIEEFQLFTEGVLAKAKEKLNKLLDAISKIIGRFIEAVNNFVREDKSYINRYKDIILTKPLKTTEYTMYPYWNAQQKLLNATVPAFNYQSIKGIKERKDMENKLFNQYTSKVNDKETFSDVIENEFRGGKEQIDIPSSRIRLKDLFNYCVDYSKNIDIIKKDLRSIDNAGKDAINKLKSADRAGVSNESAHYMEEYYYSVIENTIIYEEPLVQKKSKVDNELDTTAGRSKVDVKNVQGKNKEVTDNEAKNVNEDDVDDEVATIELYIEVCTSFLSAKMAIMEETYKAYMFILRDHIQSYVGERKKKGDNTSSNTNNSNSDTNKKTSEENKKEKEIDKQLDKKQKGGLFSGLF